MPCVIWFACEYDLLLSTCASMLTDYRILEMFYIIAIKVIPKKKKKIVATYIAFVCFDSCKT